MWDGDRDSRSEITSLAPGGGPATGSGLCQLPAKEASEQ